jgi:carboxypeptidase C (cathepsin A)
MADEEKDNDVKKEEKPEEKKPVPFKDEEPIVTEHEMTIGGKKLKYKATSGRMPLRNAIDEIEAQMFYVAYTKEGVENLGERPLIFCYNGGPGSPALWLHLGAIGPQRIPVGDDCVMPKPPFKLVDNEQTWLDVADLVFIDPIGTGYSRSHTEELGKKYWGVQGDIESVGEFIRLFLTRNERWASPLYLAGESYGTTRSAGLAGYLIDRGIAFNGIVLVSSILNFQTAHFGKGNDLPYILFLPTYTATAFYHKKLPADLMTDLQSTLGKVEEFAAGEYSQALVKGDQLPEKERQNVIKKLSRFTGLSTKYLDYNDMRIHIWSFCKELCRDEKRTVGRIDSRFKGIDCKPGAEHPEHDPSMTALMAPYTAMFNQYVRATLGYKTDLPYEIFGGIKKPWDWGSAGSGHPDTSEALRSAMAKNPHMRIYIASGYFDLATPYFATEYTVSHMELDPEVRDNIQTGEYESGHMMYVHEPSLKKLKIDISNFIS